jgi:hypothetical protein
MSIFLILISVGAVVWMLHFTWGFMRQQDWPVGWWEYMLLILLCVGLSIAAVVAVVVALVLVVFIISCIGSIFV